MPIKGIQDAVARAAREKAAKEAAAAQARAETQAKAEADRRVQAEQVKIDTERAQVETEKAQQNKQEVDSLTAGANADTKRRTRANSLLSAYADGKYEEEGAELNDPYAPEQPHKPSKRKRATLLGSFGE